MRFEFDSDDRVLVKAPRNSKLSVIRYQTWILVKDLTSSHLVAEVPRINRCMV